MCILSELSFSQIPEKNTLVSRDISLETPLGMLELLGIQDVLTTSGIDLHQTVYVRVY